MKLKIEFNLWCKAVQQLDAPLLLCAAFFATTPLYSPNISVFATALDLSDESLGLFIFPFFVATCCTGLVLVVRKKSSSSRNLLTQGKVPSFLVCGATVGAPILVMLVSLIEAGALKGAIMLAAGIADGVAQALLACLWLSCLSRLDAHQALFHLSLAAGIGSLLTLVLSFLGDVLFLTAFATLLVVGSFCARDCLSSAEGKLRLSDREAAGDDADDGTKTTSFAEMISFAAAPFAGLMVFGFVMAMRKLSVFGTVDAELIALPFAAVIALIICQIRVRQPFMVFSYQLFLPTCAIILMVGGSFPLGTVVQISSAYFMYVVYGLIALFALASIVALAHASEVTSARIAGLVVGGYGLCSLGGIAASKILPDGQQGPVALVLSMIYFAVLVLSSLWSLGRKSCAVESEKSHTPETLSEAYRRKSQMMAQQLGLSPRETEVFSYLARGHNPTFISRDLFLSLSTVRTHIRNIYRKAGVSSQEEILALIERGD